MKYEIFQTKILILKPSGVDELSTHKFFEDIRERLVSNRDLEYLIIDMKRVNYVGSCMVSGFISLEKMSNPPEIYFCNMSNSVYNVFKILKLHQYFKIYVSMRDIINKVV